MTSAAIALGSNLGDRQANLRAALARIAALPGTRLLRSSDFMENPAVDSPHGAGDFLNAAALIETDLPAKALMESLLAIERELGRRRDVPNAPRTIDLDLLLYGEQVIDEETLKVPHPRMHQRKFVLWPLLQIAPKAKDPRTGEYWAEAYHRLHKGS
ncbi:MAG: 2-amino-4-hydroxy-6-hydroxymethyldihydropteridine diphosphokinase [Planctomycetes bacterium]|nr:2-amino-4-hydroxy-6-hydroxymethyldihydropteridine diphosphokinase [Planctomycetota bacterium]MCW8135553.1 2-amino-4-hydroxy-6-hydroxymethyldihydropteridine diphosphokinase [Planctomycetota bacterium]